MHPLDLQRAVLTGSYTVYRPLYMPPLITMCCVVSEGNNYSLFVCVIQPDRPGRVLIDVDVERI